MTPRLHDFAVGRQRSADIVVRELMRHILSEGRSPGERIGSEDDLVRRFGYSRPILREALRILEREGVIEVKPGPKGGILCARPDIQPLARSLQVYGAFHQLTPAALADGRVELEVATVRLAVLRSTDDELDKIEAAGRSWVESCRANDSASAAAANVELHHTIAVAAHSPMLLIMMETAESLLFTSAYWPTDLHLGMRGNSHDVVLAALAARDADAAAQAMREHLERFRYRAEEMEREGWLAPRSVLSEQD